MDVSISTLTGESGLNDYDATIEDGFISNYLDAANDTLDAPENELAFTGQVEPFKIEELETVNATTLRLHFNRSFQIIDDLLDPTKYTLSGGLSVLGVAVISDTELDLYTSEQDPGESYTLTVTP